MKFEIVGSLNDTEIIAKGRDIRELARLNKQYGKGRWRKLKANATIMLPDGSAKYAEVHWYEANGIGRYEFKLKRFLE